MRDPRVRQRAAVALGLVGTRLRSAVERPPARRVPVVRSDGPLPFKVLSVGVDPHRQGEGIGRELMRAAMHAARNRGFTRARLTVDRDNTGALCFYRSLGWEVVEERHDGLKLERDVGT
ncbi:MAG: N-acetyltransferase [Acidimicrobiia bacterium]|nr:N-acetyltransferase [Acidimicrobiia bacterium]